MGMTLQSHRFRTRHVLLVLLALVSLIGSACSDNESGSHGARTDQKANESTKKSTGSKDADKTSETAGKPLARYAGFTSETYDNPDSWLCRPDKEDICDSGLDATVVDADGTMQVETWKANPDAPIDCFYVYPTISRDPTKFSDMNASEDEEGAAVVNQAARLGSACRVFAPIYRQRTLAGLANVLAGGGEAGTTTTTEPGAPNEDSPYADVLEAWKSYMAHDNGGRGVVVIGHSQGAGLLKQLLQEEVDPNEDVRDVFVAGYLAGTSVMVPDGKLTGGDFNELELCDEEDYDECIVTWSTFRAGSPPGPNAFFGRPSNDGRPLRSGCVNPAKLAARAEMQAEPAPADSYFPARLNSSMVSGATGSGDGDAADGSTGTNDWVAPPTAPITTPFVTTPGLISVRCAAYGDYRYLEMTANADPGPRVDDITGDLDDNWGMHLQDVNIVMGDIVRLVKIQAAAHIAD